MNLRAEYGYLIKALREYPFTKQVERRIEEIHCPVAKNGNDPNWWIRPQNFTKDPQVLTHLIQLECDPLLSKWRRQYKAITEMIEETDSVHWKIIKAVYIHNELTVEGALNRYGNGEKTYGYKNIIRPFFEKLEQKIDVIAANERINISFAEK
ncbi:hypothetical protein [Lactococcus protaetiae]|uniref:DUF722 domain-containing protein n=1 Tax=Lactococcus protaetiae TaxID=2592653 RepID=A0A514Z6W7_9LACT|nr:hypothetical protein [Lactococcus protaetiae]QDK70334.1 hypothetical protein FLP15_03070 [Lactococcus protaetiae]